MTKAGLRYYAIAKPLQYHMTITVKRAMVMIRMTTQMNAGDISLMDFLLLHLRYFLFM